MCHKWKYSEAIRAVLGDPKGASIGDGTDLAAYRPGPQLTVRRQTTSVVLSSAVRRLGFRLNARRYGYCEGYSMCRSKARSGL